MCEQRCLLKQFGIWPIRKTNSLQKMSSFPIPKKKSKLDSLENFKQVKDEEMAVAVKGVSPQNAAKTIDGKLTTSLNG